MAGLIQNTSLSKNDVLELSIPEIEGIYEGIAKTNEIPEATSGKKRLEGQAALDFLINSGGKL